MVKGCAGLGNRIFTLLEAIHYAEKTNRILLVDWGDGQYFEKGKNFFDIYFELKNSRYSSLNEAFEGLEQVSYTCAPIPFSNRLTASLYDLYTQVHNPYCTRIGHKFNLKGKLKSHWMLLRYYKGVNKLGLVSFLISCLRSSSFAMGENMSYIHDKVVVIFADYMPKLRHEMLDRLRIKDVYLTKFEKDKIYSDIKNSIGIHVRYTDLKPSVEIMRLVEHLKTHYKEKSFFLATDSHLIESIFESNFSNVLKIEKDLTSDQSAIHKKNRSTLSDDQSVIDFENSLKDLYFLSRCEKLYFQGNSSFSLLAAGWHTQEKFDWQKI